jgi:hypothetical protein
VARLSRRVTGGAFDFSLRMKIVRRGLPATLRSPRRTQCKQHGPSDWQDNVVDFVAAKASNFNKIQQSSVSELQIIQQESLRIREVP